MKLTLPFFCLCCLLFLPGTSTLSFAQDSGETVVPKKPDSGNTVVLPKKPDSVRVMKQPGVRRIDTASKKDTNLVRAQRIQVVDTVRKPVVRAVLNTSLTKDSYIGVLQQQPYFNFFGKPRKRLAIRQWDPKNDLMFYLLVGIVSYFALVKLVFSKYFRNLFTVFFQVSLKQKQIREQLLQSPLPSLLMNIFFLVCAGIYASFLLYYYKLTTFSFWSLILYSTIALSAIYLVKFLVLKLMGWIFNMREATDTYIFIVFLVNKLIGMFLVPFLVLLPFSEVNVVKVLITVSLTVIGILFGYRYLFSYAPVRKEIKVSQFHFLLYLCAFELIPLLLIYKVLLQFLERSY